MEFRTVVITGASGQVGQALLSSLQGKYESLIALVRKSAKLPANEIIADWLNSSKTEEAIAQADAVVHLAGTLKPEHGDYISANVKTTEVIVSALKKSQAKRVVFLSYVGASKNSPNAYLYTKAQAESILQASGFPLTIFRCTHIIGSPAKPGPTAENLLSKNGKAVNDSFKILPLTWRLPALHILLEKLAFYILNSIILRHNHHYFDWEKDVNVVFYIPDHIDTLNF